jgi:hypothetical protein
MVSLTIKHGVQWRAPMPLWAENSSTGIRIVNEDVATYPSILRFATDSFMQDMLEIMGDSPKRIAEWLAQPETWREPMASPKLPLNTGREDSLAYLLNKTRQQTEAYRPGANKALVKPRHAVTIAAAARQKNLPVKLFQSTHQRFYLVSASLVSSDLGCPEQRLDLSKQEKASFVLRRLVPPEESADIVEGQEIDNLDDWDEYAFISTPSGHIWSRIDQSGQIACQKLLPQEEQLPLFPVNYRDGCAHDRTVFSGLIPVGKREKWMAAPVGDGASAESAGNPADSALTGVSHARKMFQVDVAEPWKILIEQADFKRQGLSRGFDFFEDDGSSFEENNRARRSARDNIQMASWYVLLDFARFLEQYLPNLWAYANRDSKAAVPSGDELDFYTRLENTRLPASLIEKLVELDDQFLPNPPLNPLERGASAIADGTVVVSLLDALVMIRDLEDDLEAVENEFVRFDYDQDGAFALEVDPRWPGFLFPLADPEFSGPIPNADSTPPDLESRLAQIDGLAELIEKMLPEPSLLEDVIPAPGALDQRNAWFVIRCVYERPCCGPLFPALVSKSSRVFQMAPFFDPDAPTRPIRIPMPVDVSPAGLRKFQKNTAFVISDMLCGKIKKIRKITLGDLVLSVLPWPFHKDLPNPGDSGPCKQNGNSFGMICSLSIPIVTLCALILLIIMVALFDLFFRWIPFLFLCLPIPGLKGKQGG